MGAWAGLSGWRCNLRKHGVTGRHAKNVAWPSKRQAALEPTCRPHLHGCEMHRWASNCMSAEAGEQIHAHGCPAIGSHASMLAHAAHGGPFTVQGPCQQGAGQRLWAHQSTGPWARPLRRSCLHGRRMHAGPSARTPVWIQHVGMHHRMWVRTCMGWPHVRGWCAEEDPPHPPADVKRTLTSTYEVSHASTAFMSPAQTQECEV